MAAGWMNWTMQSRKAKVHPPGRLMGAVPIPDMQRSMRNWMLQSRKAKARAPVHASWAGERVWRVCLPVKKKMAPVGRNNLDGCFLPLPSFVEPGSTKKYSD